MSTTNSSTSIFPTKVLHLSEHRTDNCKRLNGFHRLAYRNLKPHDEFLHAYRGQFVRDNYHGDGQYCELRQRTGNTLIDGKFYCNNLEGYASETTSNGAYFEGLFRENARFGPGVMTNPDGTQDVGLWRGDKLTRLIVAVDCHAIPKLAVTARGKAMLIQHRQLVELPEFNQDARMYTVLKNAGVPYGTLQKYQRLCNKTCRNKDSLLFDTKLYDERYFGRKDNYINVVMNEQDLLEKNRLQIEQQEAKETFKNSAEAVAKKTVAQLIDSVMREVGEATGTMIFARELIYEALGSTYDTLERAQDERDLINTRNTQQRALKQQYATTFDRTNVKKVPVTHLIAWNNEATSIDMLKHSFLHRNFETSVNFNVCRVLAGDRCDFQPPGATESTSIKFLINCGLDVTENVIGACLDHGVDVTVVDGKGNAAVHQAAAQDKADIIRTLTNLGAKVDCVNDEQLTPLNLCLLRYLAVLYSVVDWEAAFLIDSCQVKTDECTSADLCCAFHPNSAELLSNVLSRFCNDGSLISNEIGDSLVPDQQFVLTNKLTHAKPKLKSPPKSTETNDDDDLKAKLTNIHTTLTTLLNCGAKTHICDIPLPPLHLAMYTRNPALVGQLLANGSDVNRTLDDTNLTALHLIAVLPTCHENYQIFKVLLIHSADVRINATAAHWPDETKLLSPHLTGDKNVLHMLALRYDYGDDSGGYLVAMARDLVAGGVDVGELFVGHSALSLCALRGNVALVRFLVGCVDVRQRLADDLGTVLTVVALRRFCGVISNESAVEIVDLLISSGANPFETIGESGNTLDFISSDNSAASVKTKGAKQKKSTNTNTDIKKYILTVSKNILIRRIHVLVTHFLIRYHSAHQSFNGYTDYLAAFLTYKEFIDTVQKLLYIGDIEPCPCLKASLTEIGAYINRINPQKSCPDLVDTLQLVRSPIEAQKVIRNEPEFDLTDDKMFEVCFNCLQRLHKSLVSCPACGVVWFCSELCNKADVKGKTNLKRHRCNELFYSRKLRPVQNEFERNQMIVNDILAQEYRISCVLGKIHYGPHEEEELKTNKYSSTAKSITDSCKQSHIASCCKLPTAHKSPIHAHTSSHKPRQLTTPKQQQQQQKRSLMQNLLKSLSNRTSVDVSTRTSTVGKTSVVVRADLTSDSKHTMKSKGEIFDLVPTIDEAVRSRDTRTGSKKRVETSSVKQEVGKRRNKLNAVLPRGYSRFFDAFSKIFPDFDVATLLLPYACYTNGQLYYRFLDKQPVFMETYSDL